MLVMLPWPHKDLNPNARPHFRALARAKKIYRKVVWACALEAGMGGVFNKDAKLNVKVEFFQPDRHWRDEDNMVACMKSGFDGLADALGVDDKNFKYDWHFPKEVGGYVRITVEDQYG